MLELLVTAIAALGAAYTFGLFLVLAWTAIQDSREERTHRS